VEPFLATADKLNLDLAVKGRVSGFTVARGRDIELVLYQRVSR